MRIVLRNHTPYQTRHLRRLLTCARKHLVHEVGALHPPFSEYVVVAQARPRLGRIRLNHLSVEGNGIRLILPDHGMREDEFARVVVYGMAEDLCPSLGPESLQRLYEQCPEGASYDPVPLKAKRKRAPLRADQRYAQVAKSIVEGEQRLKELERQAKRTRTLLKKKKTKLRYLRRKLETELESTEELSDKALAARLRVARTPPS